MFHNIVKILEKLSKQNLLKSVSKLPTLQITAKCAFIFTIMGKDEMKIFQL